MKRRLFLFASAFSLLICIASALLWMRTCWRHDEFAFESNSRLRATGEHRSIFLVAQRGRLLITSQWYTAAIQDPADWPADGVTRSSHSWSLTPDNFNLSFPWLHWGKIKHANLVSFGATIPFWFLCAVTAILPIWYWYLRRKLRENARHGFCVNCGYDLRATPDRCPECGTVALAHVA